jgi:hypothetical protein
VQTGFPDALAVLTQNEILRLQPRGKQPGSRQSSNDHQQGPADLVPLFMDAHSLFSPEYIDTSHNQGLRKRQRG